MFENISGHRPRPREAITYQRPGLGYSRKYEESTPENGDRTRVWWLAHVRTRAVGTGGGGGSQKVRGNAQRALLQPVTWTAAALRAAVSLGWNGTPLLPLPLAAAAVPSKSPPSRAVPSAEAALTVADDGSRIPSVVRAVMTSASATAGIKGIGAGGHKDQRTTSDTGTRTLRTFEAQHAEGPILVVPIKKHSITAAATRHAY